MPMNGGDGRSGSMHYGGTREEGTRVSTGARATIFATDGNSRKQQTKKKNKKPARKTQTKGEKSNKSARHWEITYYKSTAKKSRAERGKTAGNQPKQHEQQTRPTQAAKI